MRRLPVLRSKELLRTSPCINCTFLLFSENIIEMSKIYVPRMIDSQDPELDEKMASLLEKQAEGFVIAITSDNQEATEYKIIAIEAGKKTWKPHTINTGGGKRHTKRMHRKRTNRKRTNRKRTNCKQRK